MADIDIMYRRYSYAIWPISFVADRVLADMVCGRCRCKLIHF